MLQIGEISDDITKLQHLCYTGDDWGGRFRRGLGVAGDEL